MVACSTKKRKPNNVGGAASVGLNRCDELCFKIDLTMLQQKILWYAVSVCCWTTAFGLSTEIHRRNFVASSLIAGGMLETGNVVLAQEDTATSPPESTFQRPYAPVQALVPAIRVAIQIETSMETIKRDKTPIPRLRQAWIEQPVIYFDDNHRSTTNAVSTAPGKTFIDRYERNRNELSILQQPGALLVQRGEIGAWRNLQRRERKTTFKQPVRAALNYYTEQLQFSADSYVLSVPPEERSRMIRENKLPDINQVVTSDLDLRYLYRNQIITTMDDIIAELQTDDPSIEELRELLNSAQSSMQKWLDFIDPNDIQEARNLAMKEG